MAPIIGIIAFLTVLALSLILTRVATVALTMTGLSHEVAKFQARSAFTGTGFTTKEAEKVVNHPVRRRIIAMLMIIRSAGLVTIILSLILSLTGFTKGTQVLVRMAWLIGGVLVLWILASSKILEKYIAIVIKWALSRFTDLDTRDYASLLRLSSDYSVMEVQIEENDWLAEQALKECKLRDEGISVLGIVRENGDYVGVPKGSTKLHGGDTAILYGRVDDLHALDKRQNDVSGNQAHEEAADSQKKHLKEQDRKERKYEEERAEKYI
jgi:hypothetical protein